MSAALSLPWTWGPTLTFAQGLPCAVVMRLSVVLYKRLGVSKTGIALDTSWLPLPWVQKPFWASLIDLAGWLRRWVWALQFATAALLATVPLVCVARMLTGGVLGGWAVAPSIPTDRSI
jgi:MFS transporter, PAT family, beta-lactamase induction signal transducer AmpG